MTPTERKALDDFAAAVRAHYGDRLDKIVLFGSRARGDDGPQSDADLAIVIDGSGWRFWREKWVLAEMAYDALMDAGLEIQPWPVASSEWDDPKSHRNPRFVEAIKRDGLVWSPMP